MKILTILTLLILLTNCAGSNMSKVKIGKRCTVADNNQLQESLNGLTAQNNSLLEQINSIQAANVLLEEQLSILSSTKISAIIERSINRDLLLSTFLFERYTHFGETINILKFYTDTALIYIVYKPYLC